MLLLQAEHEKTLEKARKLRESVPSDPAAYVRRLVGRTLVVGNAMDWNGARD